MAHSGSVGKVLLVKSQSLEALVLYLRDRRIRHLFPIHGETLRTQWDPDLDPGESIADAVAGLGLSPFMVHSTSWRVEGKRIVLTFLVIIEPPAELPAGYREEPITRSELARGRPLGPPAEVHLSQVVEHGLRHLAWLAGDDPAVREALPDWVDALSEYGGEPFRAFGRDPR
jgi:hypothetical protein